MASMLPALLGSAMLSGGLLTAAWIGDVARPDPKVPIPEVRLVRDGVSDGAPGGPALMESRQAARNGESTIEPFLMMRRQVSEADYQQCINDGGCPDLDSQGLARPDFPVTGVSLTDAEAFAQWLSVKNGLEWRLPSKTEWLLAAGMSYQPPPSRANESSQAFVDQWLARYENEARLSASRQTTPKPFGSFRENENGMIDIAGNVWEWSSTCFSREEQRPNSISNAMTEPTCGIRAVMGAHVSFQPVFIRDAKGGGCGSGVPPSLLGMRLVRTPD